MQSVRKKVKILKLINYFILVFSLILVLDLVLPTEKKEIKILSSYKPLIHGKGRSYPSTDETIVITSAGRIKVSPREYYPLIKDADKGIILETSPMLKISKAIQIGDHKIKSSKLILGFFAIFPYLLFLISIIVARSKNPKVVINFGITNIILFPIIIYLLFTELFR